MLLILSGYPLSGKTTVLNLINKFVDIIIDPKEYHPPEYNDTNADVMRDAAIAAWHVSLEDVRDTLQDRNDDVIIAYDTCGASEDPMCELIKHAHKSNHRVVVAFIAANLDMCRTRSSDPPSKSVMERYHGKFKDTLPMMKRLANDFIIIRNFDAEDKIDIGNLVDCLRSKNA